MKYYLPSKPTLRDAVLKVMQNETDAISVPELNQRVYDYLKLPDEIIFMEDENGLDNALDYRMRWVRTELKKEGILENPSRGFWKLAKETK